MVDKTNDFMTEEELVAALQAAIEAQPDIEPNTITRLEYTEMRGLSEYKARKELTTLLESGTLQADYVVRKNNWGERQRIKGYRYVGSS